MLLDDLKTYLVAQGVSWTVYEGYMPDTGNSIGLFETGGYPANTLEVATEHVTFHLQVRAGTPQDYPTGRAMWKTCFDLLQDAQEITGSPTLLPGVVFVKAKQFGPNAFNDEKGRPNFTTSFRVKRYR